jgi:hypothetical protein
MWEARNPSGGSGYTASRPVSQNHIVIVKTGILVSEFRAEKKITRGKLFFISLKRFVESLSEY